MRNSIFHSLTSLPVPWIAFTKNKRDSSQRQPSVYVYVCFCRRRRHAFPRQPLNSIEFENWCVCVTIDVDAEWFRCWAAFVVAAYFLFTIPNKRAINIWIKLENAYPSTSAKLAQDAVSIHAHLVPLSIVCRRSVYVERHEIQNHVKWFAHMQYGTHIYPCTGWLAGRQAHAVSHSIQMAMNKKEWKIKLSEGSKKMSSCFIFVCVCLAREKVPTHGAASRRNT